MSNQPKDNPAGFCWHPWRLNDWPPVYTASCPAPGTPAAAVQIMFAAGVRRSFEAAGQEVKILELNRLLLLEEGVLEVPLFLRIGNEKRKCLVFPFAGTDETTAARIAGLEQALKEAGSPPPCIYTTGPVAETDRRISPVTGFRPEMLTEWEGGLPKPNFDIPYGLWWSKDLSREPEEMPGWRQVRRAFQAMAGLEVHYLNRILQAMGGEEEDGETAEEGREEAPAFSALPAEPLVVPLRGPGSLPLILCASREQGVVFYTLSGDYEFIVFRDFFWKHFAAWAERERPEMLRRAGGQAAAESPGLRWLENAAGPEPRAESRQLSGGTYWLVGPLFIGMEKK